MPDFHATGCQRSGVATKIEIRAINVLHREAHWLSIHHSLDLHGFQHFEQCRTAVPRHTFTLRCHVVAFQCRERHKADIQITRQLPGKGQIIFTNTGERLFTVIHQIHFVDRHDQMFDPQQCGDKTVTTGLIEHAFTGIDQ
ncbi:Uncharacterised protein [Shigella sonnei]|nr:Uncharacterised protein [Shigella sonnei]CSG32386.1 Uncharacterised protein [Shigella sonnei]CSG34712.1 Uncharacterised protein [Shigella sonnei]CSH63180.1 Uncharacterised protein [Shigella sonnei]CSP51115.1 Uncharacterised protein [Shigella sonnei]